MDPAVRITRVDTPDTATLGALADILVACAADGASVGFMNPLTPERARGFWEGVAGAVARGERLLFIAADAAGILGTVQVVLAQPENQPHRGDVSKLLVHPRARRRGIGELLMRAAEQGARAAGKTLLVLDTASPDAERLYGRLGWEVCGRIPDYALWPDGGLVDTIVFYKRLAPGGGEKILQKAAHSAHPPETPCSNCAPAANTAPPRCRPTRPTP